MSKLPILGEVKEAWGNLKNPDVAAWKKVALVGAAGAYVLSPIDIIPDIPIIGQVDDVAIAYWLTKGFNKLAERDLSKAQVKDAPTHEGANEIKEESIFDKLNNVSNSNAKERDIRGYNRQ